MSGGICPERICKEEMSGSQNYNFYYHISQWSGTPGIACWSRHCPLYTGSQFTAYGKLSGIELCGVSWPHNKATGEHARLLARDILRVTELSAQTLLHIQQAARYGERDPVSHSLFPMSATIAKALSKTVDSLAFFASTKFWFVFPVGCLPEVPPGDYPPKTQTITLTFTLS